MAAVRSWIRHGLVQPARVVNRLCFFDFAQVASAKALSQLTDSGVTPGRLRRSLEQIATWLPESGSALAQLETLEQGGPLVLRTDEGSIVETTGQMRLDFHPTTEGEAERAPAAALRHRAEASDWFGQGVRAEESGDLEAAVRAYERAVASDDSRAEAWFNLGNTLYAIGRLEEAEEAFRAAARIEPDYVEAWNNLANVLCEAGRISEGVAAYERAIAVAPGYADAHYNLAETLAAEGDLERARRHWRAYLEQDPHSSSAREVRERLDGLRD
jgi:tetratricopeptide (TPR) repeat protein